MCNFFLVIAHSQLIRNYSCLFCKLLFSPVVNSNCLFFRLLFPPMDYFLPFLKNNKKPSLHIADRARVESPAFSTLSGCLAAEQEELILLQEKVKNGKMSMDEALEKFKLWQMGKSGLEMIQQVILFPTPARIIPQLQIS